MKRTLAYNRYPLVICALGLLLGGLHSLFQLHQTPADTWTAAYLTAREGTELMLTENSTDPQVLRSLLHLLIGVPLLGGLFSRGYAVKGIFAATRRGRYLHFYRAEMGRLLTVTLLYNLLYCGAQALCATVAVHALPAEEVFLVDEKATNYALYEALTAHKTVAGADPIFALKGIKNEVELKNIRECHIRDGIAVVRFQMDLEKALAEGKTLTEIDIDTMLQKRRAEMPGYFEDSFDTIAAYGPNAAMMHYHAEGEVDSVIEPRGFLLVDNGGQYDCGTTDITRTYPVGPLTENERKYYTWTLQSHIDIARAVFLDYCTGFALDSFARGPLWAHKINYRCGTGHGVGYISSVHEGPQSLRPQNPIVFKEGMTITDEPGVYETDEVGIRIENELECVDAGTNQYGHWLKFEPLTLVPISTEPVIVDELTRDQINWLNAYHAHVYELSLIHI